MADVAFADLAEVVETVEVPAIIEETDEYEVMLLQVSEY